MDCLPKCQPATADGVNKSRRATMRIVVRGHVQGVGFRPHVHRLARRFQLFGHVLNTTVGVIIEVEGAQLSIAGFKKSLVLEAPKCSEIADYSTTWIDATGRTSFEIVSSDSLTAPQVRVTRDLAICSECRSDICDPGNRRHGFPFTNCTSCGPRYSILSAMPYDRQNTSMSIFRMCESCDREYRASEDRRFHSQPNSCTDCGPRVELWDSLGCLLANSQVAINSTAESLSNGKIVALKGLGGFQLLVRADDSIGVKRLRLLKNRPHKPFAVMVPSLEHAERIALLGPVERRLLQSPSNPIVLVEKRQVGLSSPDTVNEKGIADEVSPGTKVIGLFLPTTPLHHLLLMALDQPVVATSGNRGDEPIVTDELEAVRRLSEIADTFLVHNRPIVRSVDDSVVRVIAERAVTIRLSRGLAPLPLPAIEELARAHACRPMIATGGHQKTALAIWTGTQAILAQHLGDMDNPQSRSMLANSADDLAKLYGFEPMGYSCDEHPDYYPRQWAFRQNKPIIQVQHHHAHAVACMVENSLLDREVLALTWDGTGSGSDNTIWGGEILRANCTSFKRVASLLPFPLIGGEAAIRRPARIAFGLLWLIQGGKDPQIDEAYHQLGLGIGQIHVLSAMAQRKINTPFTSSVGRLFDAVAALVLGFQEPSYEGEAAVRLEAIADPTVADSYELPLRLPDGTTQMLGDRSIPRGDWRLMGRAILADRLAGVEAGVIAARFHNALAQWAADVVAREQIREVVLSGGCFQNRFLAERTVKALVGVGCKVYVHSTIPPGDGGLAAGQLAVAISRLIQTGSS